MTVCAKDRQCILASIVGAGIDRPNIELLNVGKIIEAYLHEIPKRYKNINVDKFVIMPNHIHMIIRIDECGRSMPAPTISSILCQFKSIVSKQAGIIIWQNGFYDRILRDQNDYNNVWNYIDTNPDKWHEDQYYQ